MRQLIRSAVLGGLAAVGLATAAPAAPDFQSLQVDVYDPPKPAPAFSLPSLDGKLTSIENLRGKVGLLFFWATW